MSKAILLKLNEEIFGETESLLDKIKKSRNAYFNDAVNFYNRFQRRILLKKQLKKDVKLIRESSMEAIRDFELLEDIKDEY